MLRWDSFSVQKFDIERRISLSFCYQGINAIIYVVDSNDRDRIELAREELSAMLAEEELRGAALLVLANKQDLPNSLPVSEISDRLGLQSLRTSKWFIQSTCATSGDGIYEGLDWLTRALSKK